MKKFITFLAFLAIFYGHTQSCSALVMVIKILAEKGQKDIDIEGTTKYKDFIAKTQELFSLERPPQRIIIQGKNFPIRGEIVDKVNWGGDGGVRNKLLKLGAETHDDMFVIVP